jgi:hypothetical protein
LYQTMVGMTPRTDQRECDDRAVPVQHLCRCHAVWGFRCSIHAVKTSILRAALSQQVTIPYTYACVCKEVTLHSTFLPPLNDTVASDRAHLQGYIHSAIPYSPCPPRLITTKRLASHAQPIVSCRSPHTRYFSPVV